MPSQKMPYSLADFPQAKRFASLSPEFYTELSPTPLPTPYLIAWNPGLAETLGLHTDPHAHPELAHLLSGNRLPLGAQPLASVYAGHQFGVFVPQLGDGRAILIGEHRAPDNTIHELQLKGAGKTPYSRMGDGRAVLRSSIREYLCSEAMHGLGIPTTRALGMAGSPETVWRETPETTAVVLRVAPTFVRFGHFEYFSHRGQIDALRQLADWNIEHFYPECRDQAQPYAALLQEVGKRTAQTIAAWQTVGFCHGVMNSDNMSILGLTLDYGPFGFLDGFDAGHICNHSDPNGRYAWSQQPEIALWNLQCLAQALLPLADRSALLDALEDYQPQFESALAEQFRRKLGLQTWQDDDWALLNRLLTQLQQSGTDWTLFWRTLAYPEKHDSLHDLFIDRQALADWIRDYQHRLEQEGRPPESCTQDMLHANPRYVLRNHLAEIAIRMATEGDFSEIARLQRCLAKPFDDQPEFENYAAPPPDWAAHISVSCSS